MILPIMDEYEADECWLYTEVKLAKSDVYVILYGSTILLKW